MLLRSKILVALVSVLIVFAGIHYGIQHLIVYQSYLELERVEADKDLHRCTEALANEIANISNFTHDWAAWDDLYRFAHDGNPEFIDTNLSLDTFRNYSLDIIYVVKNNGEVVWGRAYDHDAEEPEPLRLADFPELAFAAADPLLMHKNETDAVAGVFMTSQGPMIIGAWPIVKSDYKGPIMGTLIMGRFLDQEVISNLIEQVRVNFHIWDGETNPVSPEDAGVMAQLSDSEPVISVPYDDDILYNYTLFPVLNREARLLIRVDVERDISKRGRESMQFALWSIMAAGLALLVTLFFLLQRIIIGPVMQLTGHVKGTGRDADLTERIFSGRADEIGTLTREFDSMVEKLADTRKRLLDQSYYSGMAENASAILHNVKNAFSPLLVNICLLRQNAREINIEDQLLAHNELCYNDLDEEKKKDLIEFLELTRTRFSRRMADMENSLNLIDGQMSMIENILEEQYAVTLTERPIEPVDLDDLLKDAQMLLNKKDVNIAIAVQSTLMPKKNIKTHRVVMLQIIANLLQNAADALHKADIDNKKIFIRVDEDEVEGEQFVHLRFIDNGIGIDPGDLSRIFQRGFSTKGKISGFGLHWCANSIAALNGRIYAESEGVGKGACIHLLIRRG